MSFEKFNSIFKKISFVILILVVLTMPISNIVNRISSSKHDSIIEQFGAESAEAKAHEVVTILNCIYKINCMLCVISIITFLVYIGFRLFKFKNIKITKAKIIKKLPLLILAVFMALTLVGCLQAVIEVKAEAKLRDAKSKDEVSQIYKDIANWSETERPKKRNRCSVEWI